MTTQGIFLATIGATLALSNLYADEGWKPLFDGKSLAGFVKRGGNATYRVEDGCIVGTSAPNTPNTFLCTEKEFGDFRLELEFKVHPELNSGVQIRSHFAPEGRTVESAGKKIKGPKGGRVFGYQVEIDPAPRAYTAGVYDEGRRGWLQDLGKNEPARKAFKPNAWNRLAVECRGDSIKTWINDVPAADLKDPIDAKGFIALQVHGVGKKTEPLEVRWRNLRIKELRD
jgi:hypothetical protein